MGFYFSEPIWVIVTVAEGGVLGVTQQLSKFGTDFIHNSLPQDNISNPFASPTKSSGEAQSVGPSSNSSLIAQPGSPYVTQLSPSPSRSPCLVDTSGTTRSLFPVSQFSYMGHIK